METRDIKEFLTEQLASLKQQYEATNNSNDVLTAAIELAYRRQFLAGCHEAVRALIEMLDNAEKAEPKSPIILPGE